MRKLYFFLILLFFLLSGGNVLGQAKKYSSATKEWIFGAK